MSGLGDAGILLGAALGIGDLAGGLLISLLFTVFICLIPCLIFTKGKSMIAEIIAGLLGMGLSMAVGWLNVFFFALVVIAVAAFIAVEAKGMMTGGGR